MGTFTKSNNDLNIDQVEMYISDSGTFKVFGWLRDGLSLKVNESYVEIWDDLPHFFKYEKMYKIVGELSGTLFGWNDDLFATVFNATVAAGTADVDPITGASQAGDEAHIGYRTTQRTEWRVVLRGVLESGKAFIIDMGKVVFSPDGHEVNFVNFRGNEAKEEGYPFKATIRPDSGGAAGKELLRYAIVN